MAPHRGCHVGSASYTSVFRSVLRSSLTLMLASLIAPQRHHSRANEGASQFLSLPLNFPAKCCCGLVAMWPQPVNNTEHALAASCKDRYTAGGTLLLSSSHTFSKRCAPLKFLKDQRASLRFRSVPGYSHRSSSHARPIAPSIKGQGSLFMGRGAVAAWQLFSHISAIRASGVIDLD